MEYLAAWAADSDGKIVRQVDGSKLSASVGRECAHPMRICLLGTSARATGMKTIGDRDGYMLT